MRQDDSRFLTESCAERWSCHCRRSSEIGISISDSSCSAFAVRASTPFFSRERSQLPRSSRAVRFTESACRSKYQIRRDRYVSHMSELANACGVNVLTPDVRVTPISFRNLDHTLSVPSPSVSPRPSRSRGLYTSWQDHW